MKRAIILFPSFEQMHILQTIREQYDPLANCIAPHITLVFPFDSDIPTEDLRLHMNEALKGIKKFCVRLNGFTGDFRDGYLFLNVKQGNDAIVELHDRLYSGILERFLFRGITYCPHVTVGKLQQQAEFENALEQLRGVTDRFETEIAAVYVENIDDLEHSTIELAFELA